MDMVKGGKKNRVSTLSGEGAGLAQPSMMVFERPCEGKVFHSMMAEGKERL